MSASGFITNVRPRVSDAEYARLLGYPAGRQPEGAAKGVAEQARAWYAAHGRPWARARQAAIARLGESEVLLEGGIPLRSAVLAKRFRAGGAHAVVAVALSAGGEAEREVERLWQDDRPDEAFALDAFASAVVEQLVVSAGAELCVWAEPGGMAVLPHYSPGYNGWSLADQHTLYALLAAALRAGGAPILEVLSSGMLHPCKSLLAVFGITRHVRRATALLHPVPCVGCSFWPCAYRRAPFDGTVAASVHREAAPSDASATEALAWEPDAVPPEYLPRSATISGRSCLRHFTTG